MTTESQLRADLAKAQGEIERLRKFAESIVNALGPYPDLNGHAIISAAYAALAAQPCEAVGEKDWLTRGELEAMETDWEAASVDGGSCLYDLDSAHKLINMALAALNSNGGK